MFDRATITLGIGPHSSIIGNGLVYHSIDCCEYKGQPISCTDDLTLEQIVSFKFHISESRSQGCILLKLAEFRVNE